VVGERFLENPMVVITRPGDPLARKRSVAMEELAERPWLVREEGSGTRTMTEEILAANGMDPPVLTLGSNGAIKQGARAGLGVSLQSRLATRLELELGLLTTIEVRPPIPLRHWYLLRPEHGPMRAPVEEFLAFARSPEARRAIESAQES
jgi:DNA-binding transcriptional LysR family regulator